MIAGIWWIIEFGKRHKIVGRPINQNLASWTLATIRRAGSAKGAGKNTPLQVLVGEKKYKVVQGGRRFGRGGSCTLISRLTRLRIYFHANLPPLWGRDWYPFRGT